MTRTIRVDPSISRTPLPLDAEDLPTVCVLCSHNCGLRVDVADGRISAVRADAANPISSRVVRPARIAPSVPGTRNERVQSGTFSGRASDIPGAVVAVVCPDAVLLTVASDAANPRAAPVWP